MSNIFTEQPWIADAGPLTPALSGAQISVNARRSALKMLLSVVSVFFFTDDRRVWRPYALPRLAAHATN
jgi:hypothetical protein